MNTFLVELATRSVILAAIGLGLRFALLRSSAHARANVLAITMGALALLPLALIILPRLHVTVAQHEIIESAQPSSGMIANVEPTFTFPWMLIYSACVAILLARVAISLFKFKRLEQGFAHASASLTQRVLVLAVRAREVFFCPTGEPPMTWGLFQPKIALPAESEEWIEPQLRSVVLHEDAHIRRGDWAVMVWFRIVSAIYWFNPLVWGLKMLFDQDSERAADDFVLAQGVNASEYAERLVEVAKTMQYRPSMLPAVTMARSNRLNGRIAAILDSHTKRGRVRGWISVCVLAVLFTGVGAAAIVSPVVNFVRIGLPAQATPKNEMVLNTPEDKDVDLTFGVDPDQDTTKHVKNPTKPRSAPDSPSAQAVSKPVKSPDTKLVDHKNSKTTINGLEDLKHINLDDLDVHIDMGSIQMEIAKGLAEADHEMKQASKDSEKDFKDAEAEIDRTEMPEAARKMAKASINMAKNLTNTIFKDNKTNLEAKKKAIKDSNAALEKKKLSEQP